MRKIFYFESVVKFSKNNFILLLVKSEPLSPNGSEEPSITAGSNVNVKPEEPMEEDSKPDVKKEEENGDETKGEVKAEESTDVKEEGVKTEEINDSVNEHHLQDPKVTNQMAPPTQSNQIKFNITSKIDLERRESVVSSQSESEDSEFDPDGVIQESKLTAEEKEAQKPKFKGKNFVVMPPQNKDTDVSGLCSIM